MLKIGDIKRTAKSRLNEKWMLTAGVLVVANLILSATSFLIVGVIIFAGVIEYGLAAFTASVAKGDENTGFSLMFNGFNRFGDSFVAGLLRFIFTFLWSLLLIIPGIVKSYSYSMTFYIMQDQPGISGKEVIDKSRKMMAGHKGKLFLLDLSFIGWFLLSALTFGILMIFYVGPYHRTSHACFYEKIKAERSSEIVQVSEDVEPFSES